VVIAEGAEGDDARGLAERIRRSIAGAPMRDEAMRVTASIGVAVCPSDATDYDKLFEIADKRLYEAKAAGRDRVIDGRPGLRQVG